MLVIGKNPVVELIRNNPYTVKKVVLIEGITGNKISYITKQCKLYNITVEKLNRPDFESLIAKKDKSEGIAQGVIAEVTEFEYALLEEVIKKQETKADSALVILDEVQDPHNVGAVIRTAAASGSDAVIISEKNSAKVNHTVIKASSGATSHIPVVLAKNIYKTINLLKEHDFTVIGTSLKAGKYHFDAKFGNRTALVFGNESRGLRTNIIRLCDEIIKVPVSQKINSLNVSVAAGVVLYEVLRQKKRDE